MRNRKKRSLLPTAHYQTTKLRTKIRLCPSSSVRCLNKARTKRSIARTSATRKMLTRTLVVTRAKTCPRGKMTRSGKTSHIGSHFAHNQLRRRTSDTRNRIQVNDGLFKRETVSHNLLVKASYRFLNTVNLAK